MQVSRREAARALTLLRRTRRRTSARRRRRFTSAWAGSSTVELIRGHRRRVDAATLESIRRRLLDDRNWVSIERVAAARARRRAGEEPSADEVADMIVRRAICDRLS